MLPALFLSHGAPTLPFDDVPARDFLRELSGKLPKPKAIVVASAHWETAAPVVSSASINGTFHDFYGFPKALYESRYPAPGDRELSMRIAKMLDARIDGARGLDHGAWVPLMLMYPGHEFPVVQIAIQPESGVAHQIALGRTLAPLREDGALVIGSGSFTHNLRALDRTGHAGPEPDWSSNFAQWMDAAIVARDEAALTRYREAAPFAQAAHPTDEHLLPLFVAFGAGGKAERIHTSATFGSLRMDAYAFA